MSPHLLAHSRIPPQVSAVAWVVPVPFEGAPPPSGDAAEDDLADEHPTADTTRSTAESTENCTDAR